MWHEVFVKVLGVSNIEITILKSDAASNVLLDYPEASLPVGRQVRDKLLEVTLQEQSHSLIINLEIF
jgi:hypothetical protein